MPRKGWDNLSAGQRKRYLGRGRKLGMTEAQTRAYYESGQPLYSFRGHGSDELLTLAKRANLHRDYGIPASGLRDVIQDMKEKGFTTAELRQMIRDKLDARTDYAAPHNKRLRRLTKGKQGAGIGRTLFRNRPPIADIEWFFYHPS